MDIAITHLSQRKFVRIMRVFVAPISVDVINSSKYLTIDDAYVNVNCDVLVSYVIEVILLDTSL